MRGDRRETRWFRSKFGGAARDGDGDGVAGCVSAASLPLLAQCACSERLAPPGCQLRAVGPPEDHVTSPNFSCILLHC